MSCLSGCLCFYSVDDDANTMNCSYKNMTQLPTQVLPRTEQLIMSGNNIAELQTVDEVLVDVTTINLEANNITHITDEAIETLLFNRKSVRLTGNKLQQLPSSLQTLNCQTNIWLSNNLFDCNCDMMWMRDWLLNATNVKDKENITCASGKWKGQCQCSLQSKQLIWFVLNFLICCRDTNIPVRQNQNGMCQISHLDWNCYRNCDTFPPHHSYHHQ